MDTITVGKVSTRKAARYHYDVHGWAFCGAGRGKTAAATRSRFDGVDVEPAQVCRRCFKALIRALTEAAAAGDAYAESGLFWMTPDDPADDARRLAEMRAHIIDCQRPAPTPLELSGLDSDAYRRRLLAQLAAVDDAGDDGALFPLSMAA